MALDYERLPEELRWMPQWCVAGVDATTGKYKVPNTVTTKGLRKADPTNSKQWGDFETALEFAEAYPPHGIGFVLDSADPYVCIDLDIKNIHNYPNKVDHAGKPIEWTSQEDIDRFHKIIMSFHSYTERSASGQGFHVWVKGFIGKGAKRGGVEVYSQERFIVCTGDVVLDAPIAENQELLNMLVADMRRGEAPILTLVDNDQVESDNDIFARIARAENGAKFISLCEGDWAGLNYPSQSEADAALITFFAFYSKSNSQVLRMFRMTKSSQERLLLNDKLAQSAQHCSE